MPDNKNPYEEVLVKDPAQIVQGAYKPNPYAAIIQGNFDNVPPLAEAKTDTDPLAPKEPKAPAMPVFDANASALELNNQITEFLANNPSKTKEEMEREERRERISAGIRAFGNLASAFSNLAFTAQGAPSQTLPKLDDGEARIDKWRARNDKLWADYLNGAKLREQLMRQQIADTRYEREWQNRLEQQDVANKNAAMSLRLREDALRRGLANDAWNHEFRENAQGAMDAYHRATANNAAYANYLRAQDIEAKQNGGYYTRGGGRNEYVRINDGEGGYYNLPKSDMNDQTVADLAAFLGLPTTTGFGPGEKPKTRSQLMSEIGSAMQKDPKMRNKMREWADMNGYEAEGSQRQPTYDPSKHKRGGSKPAAGSKPATGGKAAAGGNGVRTKDDLK